jgi:hypothetical protein
LSALQTNPVIELDIAASTIAGRRPTATVLDGMLERPGGSIARSAERRMCGTDVVTTITAHAPAKRQRARRTCNLIWQFPYRPLWRGTKVVWKTTDR